ncbi:hypothetical protein CI102_9991 [Trichoderma harzianum]|nr:hypothetical protein CI102_9991 [Trichoderma harzianum]
MSRELTSTPPWATVSPSQWSASVPLDCSCNYCLLQPRRKQGQVKTRRRKSISIYSVGCTYLCSLGGFSELH